MGLRGYKSKRSFKTTAEPSGLKKKSSTRISARKSALSFIVQKHAARRLHYDFRLEMGGVLKSWAVPKGFPVKRGEKRLAIHVEDHPLEYAHFEGAIPKGQYGSGTVMVWDEGHYEVLNASPLAALKAGKIDMRLAGNKIKGAWTLLRAKGLANSGKESWLLLKSSDDAPSLSAKQENTSVLTRRTMKEIEAAHDALWHEGRKKKTRTAPAHA